MQKSFAEKLSTIGFTVVVATSLTITPALGAILVQNFTEWDMVVAEPPIVKEMGEDVFYDDANPSGTGILQINLGATITNDDSGDNTPGTNDTTLSHEEITFQCFRGDRAYYTDVLRLRNTTATSWDVTLRVENDIQGNNAVSDTFTAGSADIWLFSAEADHAVPGTPEGSVVPPATSPISQLPNPANYNSLTAWLDNSGAGDTEDAIQLEVVAGTLQTVAGATDTSFTVASGQVRQLALVVDCGDNMVNTQTGTFRMTVESSPN